MRHDHPHGDRRHPGAGAHSRTARPPATRPPRAWGPADRALPACAHASSDSDRRAAIGTPAPSSNIRSFVAEVQTATSIVPARTPMATALATGGYPLSGSSALGRPARRGPSRPRTSRPSGNNAGCRTPPGHPDRGPPCCRRSTATTESDDARPESTGFPSATKRARGSGLAAADDRVPSRESAAPESRHLSD